MNKEKEIEDFIDEELEQMAIDLVPVLKLRNEHAKFKQALNEIRKYINNHKRSLVHPITHEEYEELDDENINNILQIIDEVLGDNK